MGWFARFVIGGREICGFLGVACCWVGVFRFFAGSVLGWVAVVLMYFGVGARFLCLGGACCLCFRGWSGVSCCLIACDCLDFVGWIGAFLLDFMVHCTRLICFRMVEMLCRFVRL